MKQMTKSEVIYAFYACG